MERGRSRKARSGCLGRIFGFVLFLIVAAGAWQKGGDFPAEYHPLRERQLQSVAGFYGKDRSGDGEKGTDYIGR